MSVVVRSLFLSSGHSYFGRHGQEAADFAVTEHSTVDCVAGRGLRGDRFFNYKTNYRGQITFFSWEVFEKLRRELGAAEADARALRRNVVVEGLSLNELIGRTFVLQQVTFQGVEECRPCYWMDQALAPGAEKWLKGHGGLRCKILSSGSLMVGPASFSIIPDGQEQHLL